MALHRGAEYRIIGLRFLIRLINLQRAPGRQPPCIPVVLFRGSIVGMRHNGTPKLAVGRGNILCLRYLTVAKGHFLIKPVSGWLTPRI
jgi:hypothetical protein